MMNLPVAFLDSIKEVLPAGECDAFVEALGREPSCSVRLNSFKGCAAPGGAAPVAWCDEGFILKERPSFTLDPAFHAGGYYVQESASMFVGYLARKALEIMDAPSPYVLDLCAAPGGKSTHLSSILADRGTLVANEVVRGRAMVLADNIRKWGLANTIVTSSDPSAFGAMGGVFDMMLIDAPCSGEGMFRKEPQALEQWSPDNVELCVRRGRRIVSDAWDALAEGGVLIYSTCTYNRHENEETVGWIADTFGVEPVDVVLPADSGIMVTEVSAGGTSYSCYRFMPHRTDGEGLFVCLMRKCSGGVMVSGSGHRRPPLAQCSKKDESLLRSYLREDGRFDLFSFKESFYACPSHSRPLLEMAAQHLQIIYSPLLMGGIIRDEFKPSHPLALSPWLLDGRYPFSDLDLDTARDYLRRNPCDATSFADGLSLVRFDGLPIGFAKRMGGRVNNMYPKELRVVNL